MTDQKPKFLYIFVKNSYDGINIQQIVNACDDEECIMKIFQNYDLFDDMFKDNLSRDWFEGGLFEFLKFGNKEICWSDEEKDKIKNCKDYRRKLVEDNKDTLLVWIEAYYKDSENCSCISLDIYPMNSIII